MMQLALAAEQPSAGKSGKLSNAKFYTVRHRKQEATLTRSARIFSGIAPHSNIITMDNVEYLV